LEKKGRDAAGVGGLLKVKNVGGGPNVLGEKVESRGKGDLGSTFWEICEIARGEGVLFDKLDEGWHDGRRSEKGRLYSYSQRKSLSERGSKRFEKRHAEKGTKR